MIYHKHWAITTAITSTGLLQQLYDISQALGYHNSHHKHWAITTAITSNPINSIATVAWKVAEPHFNETTA